MLLVTSHEGVLTCVSAWLEDPDGVTRRHYEGETVTVTGADYERLARYGHIRLAGEPAPAPTKVAPTEVPDTEPETPAPRGKGKRKRPAKTAPVAAWRAYAKDLGVNTTGMTRFELIQAVKQTEG